MRVSCQAAAEGHVHVMKCCKPGVLESYLASKMRAQGREEYNCSMMPYEDILASGVNAATLHYVINNKIIEDNEFVLCDCGHMVLLMYTHLNSIDQRILLRYHDHIPEQRQIH